MSIKLTAQLPKDYQARTMYLYIAKTGRKWGFWFSDARGYSVPALLDGITMKDHFTTRSNASRFLQGQGWQWWPKGVTRGVPKMVDRKERGTAATRASVTSLWVESRTS